MTKSQGSRRRLLSSAAIIVAVIAAAAVALGLLSHTFDYFAWDRGRVGLPRSLRQTVVETEKLPALAAAIAHGSEPVRYAALMFSTPDRPSDKDAVALQMSYENGRVGFDWVLLAPRNIEDQEKFEAFARAHGVEPVARSINGVSYLRAECPDVAKFTASVAREMYHRPPNEPFALVYQGFNWPQS
jgi:hypothetical protein